MVNKAGKPFAGEVFSYPFMWKHQRKRGEPEGRKSRPVCVAIARAGVDGTTMLFIAPITTQVPMADQITVDVTMIEAMREGLETDKSCWVVLDEINTDVFEYSYVFEDRKPLGSYQCRLHVHTEEKSRRNHPRWKNQIREPTRLTGESESPVPL